ncbi:MAG: hypothetical protein ACTTKO_06215 [Candidatus Limimorpha sp.]
MQDNYESCGHGLGEFSCTLENLTANTTYYFRSYAVNGLGVSYGNEKSITIQSEVTLPEVITNEIVSIVDNTATGGGNVVSDGGAIVTERGLCWSLSPNPTTANEHLVSGMGLGFFSCQLTELQLNTTYYVRAYASNERG